MAEIMIFAHRGSRLVCPENTLSAFMDSLKAGADGIELDVHLTRDKVPVVIHDETLQRTTDGSGYVYLHTWKELSRLDASHKFRSTHPGEKIPALEEVLEWLAGNRMYLNIELKNDVLDYEGMEEIVLRLIDQHGLTERIILSSFNHNSIRKVVETGQPVDTSILYIEKLYQPGRYAAGIGVKGLHPMFIKTDKKLVQEAFAHGLQVRPWNVNSIEDLSKVFDLGLNCFFTDDPWNICKGVQDILEGRTGK